MLNFAQISFPDCLGSFICGPYYIEEPLVGTFCKPKYPTESRTFCFEANLSSKTVS